MISYDTNHSERLVQKEITIHQRHAPPGYSRRITTTHRSTNTLIPHIPFQVIRERGLKGGKGLSLRRQGSMITHRDVVCCSLKGPLCPCDVPQHLTNLIGQHHRRKSCHHSHPRVSFCSALSENWQRIDQSQTTARPMQPISQTNKRGLEVIIRRGTVTTPVPTHQHRRTRQQYVSFG